MRQEFPTSNAQNSNASPLTPQHATPARVGASQLTPSSSFSSATALQKSGRPSPQSSDLPEGLKHELIASSVERVREYDTSSARFQKFVFVKLILRLLTEITTLESRVKTPGAQLPRSVVEHNTGVSALEGRQDVKESEQDAFLQSDGLGYVHQHISTLVRPLIKEGILPKNGVVRVRAPCLSRELDRLAVGLGAVAKLYVAEIVAQCLALKLMDEEEQNEDVVADCPIEPRHVYEALRMLNKTPP